MLRIVVPGSAESSAPLARALRDAGHEVVHAGPDPSPEQLLAIVVQEDADAVALAGAGDQRPHTGQLTALLEEQGLDDVAVLHGAPAEVVEQAATL